MSMHGPHPIARGTATIIALAGTFLMKDVVVAAIAWFGVLIPLMFFAGIARQHGRFVLTVLAPVAIALLVVWGWLVGAPPGAPLGSAPAEGVKYACLIALRLALLGGIGQLCLSTIPHDQLVITLQSWGLRGDGLVIALGSLTLLPEMRLRAEQVLTARYARGLISDRHILTKIRQFPYLLRPLLAWVLRSAIQRSESWQQRQLLERLAGYSYRDVVNSKTASVFFILLALMWLFVSVGLLRFLL